MNKDSIISALVFGGGGGSALPNVTGNAGKVLKVNSGATGTEWGDIPDELPAIASGDAGKVLKVNAGETGTEWGDIPNELPSITGNAGKVLKVNSGGTGVEWGEGGASLYNHNITLKITKSSVNYYVTFNVISSRSADYTKETLHSYMINTIQGDTRASEIHPQDIYYDGGLKQIPSIRFSSSPAYNIKFQVVTLSDGSNSGWIDTTVWSVLSDYCYKIQ